MKIEQHLIKSLPPFPNNPFIPLTIYQNVIDEKPILPEKFEQVFKLNGWINSWRNGVFTFHHFHSSAHEVLGCYRGRALIMFGGPEGIQVHLNCGDAVLIPAGVSHRLIESKAGFHVVGAYPSGTIPDLCEGIKADYEKLLQKIINFAPPPSAPVTDQIL